MKDSIEQKCINKGVKLTDQRKIIAKIMSIFKKHKLATYEIGKITSKKGVFINSKKIA